jgi:hypothetical protein
VAALSLLIASAEFENNSQTTSTRGANAYDKSNKNHICHGAQKWDITIFLLSVWLKWLAHKYSLFGKWSLSKTSEFEFDQKVEDRCNRPGYK